MKSTIILLVTPIITGFSEFASEYHTIHSVTEVRYIAQNRTAVTVINPSGSECNYQPG
jgi:Rps23 Pro-64 3,4-dihydroxylase Tpa1-like proline 4-hydroxylase